MTDTQKAKTETMQEIAKEIRKVPAERKPELKALITGFIAGVNSVAEKQEAS